MGTIPEKYELHVINKVVQNIFLAIIKKARKMSDISDHDKGFDKRKWVYMQGYHTIYFSILEFSQKKNFFFNFMTCLFLYLYKYF